MTRLTNLCIVCNYTGACSEIHVGYPIGIAPFFDLMLSGPLGHHFDFREIQCIGHMDGRGGPGLGAVSSSLAKTNPIKLHAAFFASFGRSLQFLLQSSTTSLVVSR